MKRIMIDIDTCDGCKNCSAACMQAHREDKGDIYTLNLSDPKNESRNYILLDDAGKPMPIFCRHCDDPECAKACMSGALVKDAVTGHVIYDQDKCAVCFMCVMSCPFGVLKMDRLTMSRIIKCDFCKDDKDGPNCVRMCPKKAIHVEELD